jgi:hypothetical protein
MRSCSVYFREEIFASVISALARLIQLEGGNAAEVALVVGDEREVVMKGCCCNEEIEVADELTLGTQLTADACEVSEHGSVQRQHLGAA